MASRQRQCLCTARHSTMPMAQQPLHGMACHPATHFCCSSAHSRTGASPLLCAACMRSSAANLPSALWPLPCRTVLPWALSCDQHSDQLGSDVKTRKESIQCLGNIKLCKHPLLSDQRYSFLLRFVHISCAICCHHSASLRGSISRDLEQQ
jgi:hypothetical protein